MTSTGKEVLNTVVFSKCDLYYRDFPLMLYLLFNLFQVFLLFSVLSNLRDKIVDQLELNLSIKNGKAVL